MPINEKLIHQFEEYKELLKQSVPNSFLDSELDKPVILSDISFKYVFNLSNSGINTIRDLVKSDVETIINCVDGNNFAFKNITLYLKKLTCFIIRKTNAVENNNNKPFSNCAYPKGDKNLNRVFEILLTMSEDQLNQSIDYDLENETRIRNAFDRLEIYTLKDLKNKGYLEIGKINGLGKNSYQRILQIVERHENANSDNLQSLIIKKETVLTAFKKKIISCNNNKKAEYLECDDFNSIKIQLFDYIFSFVKERCTERKARIYINKNNPNRKVSLQEIADDEGVTRERIRQVVAVVDKKLDICFTSNHGTIAPKQVIDFYSLLLSVDDEHIMSLLSYLTQKNDGISKIISSVLFDAGIDKKDLPHKKVEIVQIKKRRKAKPLVRSDRVLIDRNEFLEKVILSVIRDLEYSCSVDELIAILKGKDNIEYDFKKHRYFGICKGNYSEEIIKSILEYYLGNYLVRDVYGTLVLTDLGKERLKEINRAQALEALN